MTTEQELIREWEADGFRLEMYDTHESPRQPRWIGETNIGYRLYDNGRLVFSGEDYGVGRGMCVDSDQAVSGLLGFLSLQPGDTDPEYFASYTPDQLAWVESGRAEDLALIVFDMEDSDRD